MQLPVFIRVIHFPMPAQKTMRFSCKIRLFQNIVVLGILLYISKIFIEDKSDKTVGLSVSDWYIVSYFGDSQSCRMSRIPQIYPCKKVAKHGKMGYFNWGKSHYKCFLGVNYLTF